MQINLLTHRIINKAQLTPIEPNSFSLRRYVLIEQINELELHLNRQVMNANEVVSALVFDYGSFEEDLYLLD
jgi:hypothetical protein